MAEIIPSIENYEQTSLSVKGFGKLAEIYLTKDSSRSEQVNTANAIIATNINLFRFEKPELTNRDDCMIALNRYFEISAEKNTRPTISGICLSLGLTRKAFLEACDSGEVVRPGKETVILPDDVLELFVFVRENYISMIEGFMESNVLHPSAATFLLKNNGDYKDVVERKYSVTQVTTNSEQLAKKYAEELSDLE